MTQTKHIKTLKPSEVWQYIVDTVGYDTPIKLGVDNNAENEFGYNELYFVAEEEFNTNKEGYIITFYKDTGYNKSKRNKRDYAWCSYWTDGTYTGYFYVLDDSDPKKEPETVAENETTKNEPQTIDFSKIKVGDKVWVECEIISLGADYSHDLVCRVIYCNDSLDKVDKLINIDQIKAHFPQESELEKAEEKVTEFIKLSGISEISLNIIII